MLTRHSAGVVRQDLIRLCYADLNSIELRQEAIARLRQFIPLDSFWFATADPATLLFTGSLVEGIPEAATPLFVANEFLQDDVNKWSQLSVAPIPVNSLYQATKGRPDTSARFRDICQPMGLEDELRAVLRSGSLCWGFMCLHRERNGIFRRHELDLLADLSSHLANGLRRAVLQEQSGEGRDDGPGLLTIASDMSVTGITPAGERWLSEIADWPNRQELPQVIHAAIARLSRIEDGLLGSSPRARVQTRSGEWIIVHASRMSHRDQRETAIILEPATPAELAPLLLQAYGLTRREGEIAQLVLRGCATSKISIELRISEYTVQQHLKAVFEKVGVGSRRELVAQIFARHYRPIVRKPRTG